MAGFERETETPLDYARAKVDPALGVGFEEFMRLYLRLKYSRDSITAGDHSKIKEFAKAFGSAVNRKIGLGRAILNYFNLALAARYFQTPQTSEHETSAL